MKLVEILTRLRQPVPKSLISTRKQGGTTIEFISWSEYADLLDARAGLGNWSWNIKEIKETQATSQVQSVTEQREPIAKKINARLIVVGELHLYGEDRSISFSATGEELLVCSGYGDPASNASAMALRRACAMAGLSRQLWQK
jgi:hypothetical protein